MSLSRDKVSDIVNARLTDEELVEELRLHSTENITGEILRLFIEVTRETVEGNEGLPAGDGLIDVSGTGGSGIGHFNTSTFCAFVLASGGVRVAKFGNRASRSGAGSADLLEAMGIPLDLPASRVKEVVERERLAFLFAPHFYPGLKRLANARRVVGQPTVFNHIGPLLNPVNPEFRLLGMSSQEIFPLVVEFLSQTKSSRTLVVRSQIGMDELVPGVSNSATLVESGQTRDMSFPASVSSVFRELPSQLDLAHNVQVFQNLLNLNVNEKRDPLQPWFDLVALNAGAGFFVARHCDSISDGVQLAEELILSGKVKEKFLNVRQVYEKCSA